VIPATLRRWSAWSPGCEDSDAWRRWCSDPGQPGTEGRPAVEFLPPMLRRRCSNLARIMLSVAFDCCGEEPADEVATVFASRHGNINESIDLLDRLALHQPLSPTRFSHTVHNAQAALFSIAAGNRAASSSIAAQEDTFGAAYLEALTFLERAPRRPVLLVMADVPLAPTFAALVDEPLASYGLALLLARDGEGTPLDFGIEPEQNGAARPRWPDALEFLRWLLSDEPRLDLGRGRRRWVWEKPGLTRSAARSGPAASAHGSS
jgi:hypothetical protein